MQEQNQNYQSKICEGISEQSRQLLDVEPRAWREESAGDEPNILHFLWMHLQIVEQHGGSCRKAGTKQLSCVLHRLTGEIAKDWG